MKLGFDTATIKNVISERKDRTGLITTHPELINQSGDITKEELLVVHFPDP